jgi:hypothetical protein
MPRGVFGNPTSTKNIFNLNFVFHSKEKCLGT